MVDLSWSCLNPQKQIQCEERIVNIISTYPIILEWKFSYIKKLIKNCENYKQTCSKQKIGNVSSVNESHKIDTSSRVRKTELMRARQNVPGRSKMASKPWNRMAYRTLYYFIYGTQIVSVFLRRTQLGNL